MSAGVIKRSVLYCLCIPGIGAISSVIASFSVSVRGMTVRFPAFFGMIMRTTIYDVVVTVKGSFLVVGCYYM